MKITKSPFSFISIFAFILAAMLAAAVAPSLAQKSDMPQSQHRDFVTVEPVQTVQAKPGAPSPIVFHFTVVPGMHINSHKPLSDLLIATDLKIDAAEGVAVDAIDYPAGHSYSFSAMPDEKLDVYSGDFTITARMKPARTAKAGNVALHATLEYQACDNRSCFPPKTLPLAFEIAVASPATTQKKTN